MALEWSVLYCYVYSVQTLITEKTRQRPQVSQTIVRLDPKFD